MTPEQRAFRNRLMAEASIGEKLFGDDEPERLMQTMRRRHELARLPPSPGVVELDHLEEVGAKHSSSRGGGGGTRHYHARGSGQPDTGITHKTVPPGRGQLSGGATGAGLAAAAEQDNVWERLSIKSRVRGSAEPPSLEMLESPIPDLETVQKKKTTTTTTAVPVASAYLDDEPPALEKVGAHLGAGVRLGGGHGVHVHAGKGHHHNHSHHGHHDHHHHHQKAAAAAVEVAPVRQQLTEKAMPSTAVYTPVQSALPSLDFLKSKKPVL